MITPATPVKVKSGTKATAMMSVDENTGGPTSRAALAMRSKIEPPRRARLRKMLSIMITDESTTMPKSTAPSEMRLACVPVDTMPKNAKSRASGRFNATSRAARSLPKKSHSTNETSTMPVRRFSITVWVVSLTRSARS